MQSNIFNKLKILAESAKYDASCSSSGVSRTNTQGGLGSSRAAGLCHTFTSDGRCVCLLKVLYTNACIYDCAYCINRSSNDTPRASFTVNELVSLTIEFYRRNYIEGLFLSSGVVRNPDYTMERMIRVLQLLRTEHQFNGYIHMKSIPGASQELVRMAGLYADRMSVNIEIPSNKNLIFLAPEKNHQSVYTPMHYMHQGIEENREDKKRLRNTPTFIPAGQSTQMIVGATNERDNEILQLSSALYTGPALRRVYYSAFIPVNSNDPRLPARADTHMVRENRLYQADWLMRFYHFTAEEIANEQHPNLDLELDPKSAWALRNPEFFPINVNTAEYTEILRVPGIGVKSAHRIIAARRFRALTSEHLTKMGVVMKRAQYFLTFPNNSNASLFTSHWQKQVRFALTSKKKKAVLPQAWQLPLPSTASKSYQ